MKEAVDFFSAWGGISGVQATLRALLTLELPAPLVARLVSENVARRFALPGKGGIRLGADADLVLVDLGESRELARDELLDHHRLSPYVGRLLRGAVRRTVLRGRTIFIDGRMNGAPEGKFLRPARD
jgi:allantoinase